MTTYEQGVDHVRDYSLLDRWPALAPPDTSAIRARVARSILRRGAVRAGIRVTFSDGSAWGPLDAPTLNVIDERAFLARLGHHGKIGFGEAYMAGDWTTPDLVAVLTPMARHIGSIVPKPLQRLRTFYDMRLPRAEDNTREGARTNISRHYDLSNDLFATFLDETMTYSSALLAPGDTLAEGQARKIERLLDAVGVRPGARVLEVGTGWGELALRAARRGATVHTVTLSQEQATLARRRIAAAGLTDRVTVEVSDYRDVSGQFDAIVSVEMIEAVGERWWPTYFATLDRLLAPGGRIGLQAILMPHERMLATRRSYGWIHKYVFPGGLIPSERAIEDTLARHTTLRVEDRLHFGLDYAETLRVWRERFTAASDEVAALGFDETFRRMWTFYLAYCEAGFRANYLDVAQYAITR